MRAIQYPTQPYYSLLSTFFLEVVLDKGLTHQALHAWPTDARAVEFDEERYRRESASLVEAVGFLAGALIQVELQNGSAVATIAADCHEVAEAGWKALQEQLPAPGTASDQRVTVTFWHHTQNGPRSVRRKLLGACVGSNSH